MNRKQKFRLVKCCKRLVSASAGILLVSQVFVAPLHVLAETNPAEVAVEMADNTLSGTQLDLVQNDRTKDVKSTEELKDALADESVDTIYLIEDFELTESMYVLRTVTIKSLGERVTLTRGTGLVGSVFSVGADDNAQPSALTLENLILDGKEVSAEPLVHNSNGTVTLSNSKITGGHSTAGSGIYSDGGTVNINNGSEISGNNLSDNATGGGGIYGSGALIAISDSTVTNNGIKDPEASISKNMYGGGIYVTNNSDLKISRSNISENYLTVDNMSFTSFNGGGIALTDSRLTLDQASQVKGNTLSNSDSISSLLLNGGGIYLSGGAATFKGESQVNENTSAGLGNGGGMHITENAKVTIADAQINQNVAGYGGGIYIYNGGKVILSSGGEISGNSASHGGAIFANSSGTIDITGGMISDNHARFDGGALCLSGATANISGGIIQNNSIGDDGRGSAIFSQDFTDTTVSGGLIYGPKSGTQELIDAYYNTWEGPTGNAAAIAKTSTGPYEWGKEDGLDPLFGENITEGKAYWTIHQTADGEKQVGINYSISDTEENFFPVEEAQLNVTNDLFNTDLQRIYNGDVQPVSPTIATTETAFYEAFNEEVQLSYESVTDAIEMKNAGTYNVTANVPADNGVFAKGTYSLGQVTIAKATPAQADFNYPENTTFTYEGSEISVTDQITAKDDTLTDFSVKYVKDGEETDAMTEAGTYQLKIIVGEENLNFNAAEIETDITLTVTEKSATPDPTTPETTPTPDPEETTDPDPEQAEDRQALYRVYNPNNGEHLYTIDLAEAQGLIELGWQDEGIGWYGGKTTGKAVYRLYNQNSGEHFYTLDAGEYDNVASAGWTKEGVAFYAAEDTEIPIYRVFNPNSQDAGSHHYTLSSAENSWLISEDWRAEGTAFYGK